MSDSGASSAEGTDAECNSAIRQSETLRYRERISVETAKHIARLLEGDFATEEMIMRFIKEKYNAPTVLDIPPKIAREIIRRPGDFIRAARRWAEPELF